MRLPLRGQRQNCPQGRTGFPFHLAQQCARHLKQLFRTSRSGPARQLRRLTCLRALRSLHPRRGSSVLPPKLRGNRVYALAAPATVNDSYPCVGLSPERDSLTATASAREGEGNGRRVFASPVVSQETCLATLLTTGRGAPVVHGWRVLSPRLSPLPAGLSFAATQGRP